MKKLPLADGSFFFGGDLAVQTPYVYFKPTASKKSKGRRTIMTTQAQVQGLGLYMNWGFSLYRPDDHSVALLHEGRSIALFSQTGATLESLQAECSLHLVKRHGWEGCLYQQEGQD